MTVDVEKLADAGRRYLKKMDLGDLAALKFCLLSTGTLMGLSLQGKAARRLAGVVCSFLTVGLAVPLASRYLDELRGSGPIPESLYREWEEHSGT